MMTKNELPQESRGLGDTIAKITHATGLDVVAENIAHALGKEDCGCSKRREVLNELFPYKQSTPATIPTPLAVGKYIVNAQLTVVSKGQSYTFLPGEVLEVTPEHILSPYINNFVNNKTVQAI